MTPKKFRTIIYAYYRKRKREFPWRNTRDPYAILISEVMLQQTQTSRVFQKFELFLKRFPTFGALAHAPVKNLLGAWQGLGYNRRALALQRTAQKVKEYHSGALPRDLETLVALPGIGKASAGAIMAFAFNQPVPFIETNIRRTFIHFFFGDREKVADREILPFIERTLDQKNPREWYYALMDYGAMLGKAVPNPNRQSRHYMRQKKFKGSVRELRGKIVRYLLRKKSATPPHLAKILKEPMSRIHHVVRDLKKDGFLDIAQEKIQITRSESRPHGDLDSRKNVR